MSRIGKVPVDIPSGVEVKLEGNSVTIKGPKGSLEKEFSKLAVIEVTDNQILVKPADKSRSANAAKNRPL